MKEYRTSLLRHHGTRVTKDTASWLYPTGWMKVQSFLSGSLKWAAESAKHELTQVKLQRTVDVSSGIESAEIEKSPFVISAVPASLWQVLTAEMWCVGWVTACFGSPLKDACWKPQKTGTDLTFLRLLVLIPMPLSVESQYLEVMILQKELRHICT